MPGEPAAGAGEPQTWSSDLTAGDKERLLGEIDQAALDWKRTDSPERPLPDAVEIAQVVHTDGELYTLLRSAADPATVLLFDRAEWKAYLAAVKDGYFDV